MDNKGLSIENYNRIKEEQAKRNPMMYGASVDVGVEPTSNPLTYNVETPNVEVQELSEGAKNELVYLGKSAEVGFKKGIDLLVAVDQGIQKLENPITVDTPTKQWAMDAIAERDAFYLANQKDISGATEFVGGMVETMSNPVELGINVIEGALTGGSSLVAKLGMTALYNGVTTMGIENIYSKRYTGEYLSLGETAKIGAQTAILSGIMTGIGEVKSKYINNHELGDKTINVKKNIDTQQDMFTYDGNNVQKMFTNYQEQMSSIVIHDPYEVKFTVSSGVDPSLEKGTVAINVTPYDFVDKSLDNVDVGYKDTSTFQRKERATVLGRKWQDIRAIDDRINYIKSQPKEVQEAFLNELNTNINVDTNKYTTINVPMSILNKDAIVIETTLNNKTNLILDEVIRDIAPTVKYAYENWKSDDGVNRIMVGSYAQIDDALHKIDNLYKTQKLYCQEEYLNLVNKQGGSLDVNGYINNIKDDKIEVARKWINGMEETVVGDDTNFLREAYNDSVRLDQLDMKNSLFDMEDYKGFMKKYGKHFDEDGNLIYSDTLIKDLTKEYTKGSVEDIYQKNLLTAFRDNEVEYSKFMAKKSEDVKSQNVKTGELRKKKLNSLDKRAKEIENLEKLIEANEFEVNKLVEFGHEGSTDYINLLNDINKYNNKLETMRAKYNKELDTYNKWVNKHYLKFEELNKDLQNLFEIKEDYIITRDTKTSKFVDNELREIVSLQGKDRDKLMRELKSENGVLYSEKVAKAIANNKKKLAIESIKINQIINKQKMLGVAQEYFTASIDKDNVGKLGFREGGLDAFIKEIIPFYENGIFKMPEDVYLSLDNIDSINKIARHFQQFIMEYKDTRGLTKALKEYKTVGDLRKFFNDDRMVDFFVNYKEGVGVKEVSELVRDIFDINTSKTARYMTYGSTSPFAFKHKVDAIQQRSKQLFPTKTGEEGAVFEVIRERGGNMLQKVHHMNRRVAKEHHSTLNDIAKTMATTKYLAWSGLKELFGSNYALGMYRASKYIGIDAYKEGLKYFKLKFVKAYSNSTATINPKLNVYSMAQLEKTFDLKDLATREYSNTLGGTMRKGLEWYNDKSLVFQAWSDRQLKSFGDAISTQYLDNLPEFAKLDNEMKSLLRVNGINEKNYDNFRNFSKKHIEYNNKTINMNELVDLSTEDIRFKHDYDGIENVFEMSRAMRNVSYSLYDYIGNVKVNNKFDDIKVDAFTSWSNMFRSFSRAVNGETLKRLYYYTNAEGVGVPRVSTFNKGVKNVFSGDLSMAKTNIKEAFSGTTSGMLAIPMMSLGGLTYSLSGDIFYGNRQEEERLALVETKLESLIENPSSMLANGPLAELVSEFTDSKNIIGGVIDLGAKAWDIFTDEEKKAFGTRGEEGVELIGGALLSLIGKNVINTINLALDDNDLVEVNKVWGLSRDKQLEYETKVMKWKNRKDSLLDLVKLVKEDVSTERRVLRAESDYMEGNLNSFNALPNEDKTIVETVIKNAEVENVKESKSKYTILLTQAKGMAMEDKVAMLAEDNPTENINVENSINELKMKQEEVEQAIVEEQKPMRDFNTIGKGAKNLFNEIMRYKGVEKVSDKDKEFFIRMFEKSPNLTLEDILTNYNIDMSSWIKSR